LRIFGWTFALTLAISVTARAQGVYTAAVQGTVHNAQNQPLPNATVMLTNQATGDRWGAVTSANGRYAIENVPVGGPYTLLVRIVGYAPAQQNGIQLVLGQRLDANLTLEPSTVKLETVQVVASKSPLQDITRTGESTTISDSAVHSLPTITRDFQGFLETAPEVSFASGGMSIAGQNSRLNNILIDGSVNNDLFGLADNGLPGGQVGGRAISLEAVDQLQLQVAPYDVRLGGFTGGLLNVVTKSGTNQFHRSAFEYFRNQSLVGSDIFGVHIPDFSTHQWGASVGGPIVPDRAHFFIAFEQRSTDQPALFVGSNDSVNAARLGYTLSDLTAISNHLTALGVKPGSFGSASLGNPNPDVFAKVDFQLAPGNTITLSENYVTGYEDFLDRGNVNSSAYDLSSAGHRIKNYNTDTRLDWSASFGGRFANDLILSAGVVRDKRDPASTYATIDIFNGNGDYLAGAEEFSQQNRLYQTVDEITDNLTIALGDHHLTVGTHDEFYHFHNEFFPQSFGRWQFNNLHKFLVDSARAYFLATPTAPGGPTADFAASQVGFYAQDQWNPVPRLSLSGGVRFDVPFVPDKPGVDQKLLTQTGINTGAIPNSQLEISPRLGFNYDVLGDRSTIVRGGTGLFQGRPLFVWISNAFSNTGANQTLLTCRGSAAPAFNAQNLATPPTACNGAGSNPPIPTVNYFDNNLNFPQNWRTSLGFDRDLGHGFLFSLDGLYNVAEHQLYIEDVNIRVVGTLAGEGGRPIYGVPDSSSAQTDVTHIDKNYGPILHHVNRNGDYSYSITPQINKTFGRWLLGRYAEIHASYTYSQSYDRMSLSSSIAESNYGFSEISGTSTIFNRPLAHSEFETPHQIKVSAMNVFPLGIKGTLFYVGRSGTSFSYAVNGDVAGLGSSRSTTHDLIYVPKSEDDIDLADNQGDPAYTGAQKDSAWAQLNRYINSQSCLANSRGQIMRRSVCHNPWQDIINARIAKDFTVAGQSVELSWDVFNLPNLLDRNWGQYKQYTPFEDADLFTTEGYNATRQRFIYNFNPISKTTVTDPTIFEPSVWRMQVGVRYSF